MSDGDIVIDEPDEAASEQVVELGREVFPLLYRRSVQPTEHMLCGWLNGELAGGLIMEIHSTPTEQIGIISWVFTAEDARGHGIGSQLVTDGLSYLQERGCTHVVADIEGHNTSSNKLFARAGFEQTTSTQLIQRVGLRSTVAIWKTLVYYVDFGHFLWSKRLDEPTQPSKPTAPDTKTKQSGTSFRSLFGSWSLNFAVLALAYMGLTGLLARSIPVAELVTVVGIGAVVFVIREAPLALLARFDSDQWRYQGWLNGIPMSAGIGLIFGLFFPMLGSLYPRSLEWAYREKQHLFGIGATISTCLLIALLIVTQTIGLALVNDIAIASVAPFVLAPFLIVDHLLFFTPFQCYHGRRIYNWNRAVWGVLTIAIVLTLLTIV